MDASHFLSLDAPDEVVAAVREFGNADSPRRDLTMAPVHVRLMRDDDHSPPNARRRDLLRGGPPDQKSR